MTISEEIESKIDIVELVREYVPLRKAGVNYKWLSPFKNEKTPSFVVSPAKQIAYCFSTNQGGWPIKFLMLIEKLEFKEALHILAKRAGVELKTDFSKESGENTSQIYQAYEIALDFYHEQLFQDQHKDKLQYLLDRGLTIETIKQWKIGFSDNPRDLYFKLKDAGLEDEVIIQKSGLFISPHKDKFYSRVIFPIYNYRGSVVAFSGRTLSTEKNIAKYVNSPETPIFHKSNILFGMDVAKRSITHKKAVIVVEGQMDVISLHQAGFDNVVGISGTALTESHIRQIRRLTDQVYLCLDNDDAGKKATFSCIESLSNQDMDIHIIQLGDYKDPDEILQSETPFQDYVERAISHIEFMLVEWSSKYDIQTVQWKKKLIDEIMQYLIQIESAVEVDLYLQHMSSYLGISLQILWATYNTHRENLRFRSKPKQVSEQADTYKSSSPAEDLMVFIIGMKYADFFRDEFLFFDHSDHLPHLQPVFAYLENAYVSEQDKMRYELIFEQRYGHMSSDEIAVSRTDMMRRINQKTFDFLQKHYSSQAGDAGMFQKLNALNEMKPKLFW